jgi:hypothetical protein
MEYILSLGILSFNLIVGLAIFICFSGKEVAKLNCGYVLSLSYGLGIGALSYAHFIGLTIGLSGDFRWVIDIIGLIVALVIIKKSSLLDDWIFSRQTLKLSGLLSKIGGFWALGIALVAIFYALKVSFNMPYGTADAVTNWYPKARFIFFSDDGNWVNMFSKYLPNWMHSDYPLLFPLSLVRGWTYFGYTSYIYAIILQVSIFAAAIGLVYFTLLRECNRIAALVGLVIFVSMPNVYFILSLQYADIFLLYFLAAGISLLCISMPSSSWDRSKILIAILISGFAAWTKNEGWLILLCILFSVIFIMVFVYRDFRGLIRILCMTVLSIFIPLFYQWLYAPVNDIVNSSLFSTLNLLVTHERFMFLLMKIRLVIIDISLWYFSPFILFVIFVYSIVGCFYSKSVKLDLVLAMMGVVVGYIVVLLLVPIDYNYEWFLQFSLHRILFQIYPSLIIFTFCLTANTLKPPHAGGLKIFS